MIYIIHDKIDWLSNLITLLDKHDLPYTEWNLKENPNLIKELDLTLEPPKGIFYNRISASSHTRDARFALEHCKMIVQWLERWNRPVINGTSSLEFELSKFKQYLALTRLGVNIPKTYLATSKEQIIELSGRHFQYHCIVKDNRSGSGIGVKLVNNREGLIKYLESPDYKQPIDGITLIQQYIQSPEPFITRVEIINHQFIYAVKVNTEDGFNLCPADHCSVKARKDKFQILLDLEEKELLEKYIQLTRDNNICICGIEFVRDGEGKCWTYDLNCNTNYNSKAEKKEGIPHLALEKLIELMKDKLGRSQDNN